MNDESKLNRKEMNKMPDSRARKRRVSRAMQKYQKLALEIWPAHRLALAETEDQIARELEKGEGANAILIGAWFGDLADYYEAKGLADGDWLAINMAASCQLYSLRSKLGHKVLRDKLLKANSLEELPPRAAGLFTRQDYVRASLILCYALTSKDVELIAHCEQLLCIAMGQLRGQKGYDIECFAHALACRHGIQGAREVIQASPIQATPYTDLLAKTTPEDLQARLLSAMDYRCSRQKVRWSEKPEDWSLAAPFILVPIDIMAFCVVEGAETLLSNLDHPVSQSLWCKPRQVSLTPHVLLKDAETVCAKSLFPLPKWQLN